MAKKAAPLTAAPRKTSEPSTTSTPDMKQITKYMKQLKKAVKLDTAKLRKAGRLVYTVRSDKLWSFLNELSVLVNKFRAEIKKA